MVTALLAHIKVVRIRRYMASDDQVMRPRA
jgi:hypothetical protein